MSTLVRTAGITALAGLVVACSHEPPAPVAEGTPIDVTVAKVATADLHRPFESGGTVRARTTATIVARIVAEVREVRVRPGDRVRAGQPLIVLDSRDLAANRARAEAGAAAADAAVKAADAGLQAAEAGLKLADATHRRIAGLADQKAATAQELDQAVAGLRAAQAQADAARAQAAAARSGLEAARAAADAARVMATYAVLTAPFDGVVTEKLVEPGNMASPGVPLMSVEDTREFRLETRVDESRAALVTVGEPVEVELGGAEEPGTEAERRPAVTGKVSEIARALDPGSHAYLIKVGLPGGVAVRSGMYGRARFAGPSHQALAVPVSSLVRHGQLVGVFVVGADHRARMRLLNVAETDGGRVEVLAGLDAGETIVLAPPPALTDGAPVTARAGGPLPGGPGLTPGRGGR
jgi:RND family efflux transporter MFP subunit